MIRALPLLFLFACGGDEVAEPPPAPPAAAPVGTAAAPAAPAADLPRVPSSSKARFAASHVLVSYAGAVGALPTVTRTKEDARTRAAEARARIAGGEAFAEVAKAYSDDSSGSRGGSLGGFDRGTMVAPFEAALDALAPGEVSELVETQFGYHVILREPLKEIRAKHLLVSWSGAERAPPGVSRKKDDARARVDEAVGRLAAGEAWDEVVRAYSDGPMKDDGGDLGWFAKGQLAEPLDAAAFDLDVGATSVAIETPRGFHLIHRVE
jgi:peptidyl-prolyl cis-trans isomerase SurA